MRGTTIFAIALSGAVGFGLFLAWMIPLDGKHACDRAAERLFHSPDLLEVIRSGFLVVQLDCGLRRRIPEDWR